MGLFKDCGCGCDGKKQEQKLVISFMAALIFFIIASPDAFRFMRRIFGKWVSSPTGCPTSSGLLFHTTVFMFVTWGMMNIKKSEKFTDDDTPNQEDVEDLLPEDDETDDEDDEDFDDEDDEDFDDEDDDDEDEDEDEDDVEEYEEEDDDYLTDEELDDVIESSVEGYKVGPSPDLGPAPRKTQGKKRIGPAPEDISMAPVRMSDAPSPLPKMKESPIGMYDSGMIFSPMDVNSGMDKPSKVLKKNMKIKGEAPKKTAFSVTGMAPCV
tara:strand:+ start:97 stop:897 length:801 start_codon:yes stop_codon:yes gene_type:complete